MDRRAFTRVVHVAKRQLALDDDCYRDLLEKVAGVRSAAQVPEGRFNDVLKALKRAGFQSDPARRSPQGEAGWNATEPFHWKAVALWLSLWNLGELETASPAALNGFVRRQTGVDALRFLAAGEADKVIEALKSRCARAGYEPAADALESKRRLLRAQWARLGEWNVIGIAGGNAEAFDFWLSLAVSAEPTPPDRLTARQLDRCAEMLGGWLRANKPRAEATP